MKHGWVIVGLWVAGCDGEGSREGLKVSMDARSDARTDTQLGADVSVATDTRVDVDEETYVDAASDTQVPDEVDVDPEVVFADEPAILAAEGPQVAPQTVMHLEAVSDVAIVGYRWSVEQPAGSVSRFAPSDEVRAPTFEANVAGAYVFTVVMTTASGAQQTQRYNLWVVPDAPLHVELLWRTPGDLDESDVGFTLGGSVGSDVDLHFLHPDATGYFDDVYDTFYINRNPNWEGLGASDDPALDRDDTDGAGPENLNLTPAAGRWYVIGVHYWDDWSFGQSFATVRVYLDGVLAYELAHTLKHHDMWDVAEVCADGTITTLDTVQANYPIPF